MEVRFYADSGLYQAREGWVRVHQPQAARGAVDWSPTEAEGTRQSNQARVPWPLPSKIVQHLVVVRRKLPSRDLSVENLVAASVETAN